MTKETIDKLEQAYLINATDKQACLHAGIAVDTLYKYQRENPDFIQRKQALKENLAFVAKNIVARNLNKQLKEESYNTADAKWVLSTMEAKTYGNHQDRASVNQVQHAQGDINIIVELDD
jgi:hypothetical protein